MSMNLVRALLILNAAKKGWTPQARAKAAAARKAKKKPAQKLNPIPMDFLKSKNAKKAMELEITAPTLHPAKASKAYKSLVDIHKAAMGETASKTSKAYHEQKIKDYTAKQQEFKSKTPKGPSGPKGGLFGW